MNFAYLALKKIFPELNVKVVAPPRILEIFEKRHIHFQEVPMSEAGCYVHRNKKDYVFLRSAMHQLLYHETLAYEGSHALLHYPAPFLLWRHSLEAEVMSLICMMPLTELKHLNRVKHHLDEERYEFLMKRNLANERWKL